MARNVQKLVMYDPRSVVRLQTKIPPAMMSLKEKQNETAPNDAITTVNYLREYRSPI